LLALVDREGIEPPTNSV